MDEYLSILRRRYYILPCAEPLGIGVSGEFSVTCVVAEDDCCVVKYVVRNVLWLPFVVDWSIGVAVVFSVIVTDDVEIVWPLWVVNVVRNVVHFAGDIPRDIALVVVDEANVVEARVLVVTL